MGYQNANRVRSDWTHLPGNAYKALTEMAWTARDEDRPPRYWAGPGLIARSLGKIEHENDPITPTVRRIVVEVIRQLIDAKAIERVQASGPGTRAEYALRLWNGTCAENPLMLTGAENPLTSATDGAPTAEHERKTRANVSGFSVQQERKTRRTGAENPLPKEQQEQQETKRGTNSPLVSTSPASAPPNGHPDDPHPPTQAQVAALRASNRRH